MSMVDGRVAQNERVEVTTFKFLNFGLAHDTKQQQQEEGYANKRGNVSSSGEVRGSRFALVQNKTK